jgi:site-specific DNA recombinase
VQQLFSLFLECGSVADTAREANRRGWTTRRNGKAGGNHFAKPGLYHLLTNPAYVGRVRHNGSTYEGEHDGIIDPAIFDEVQRRLQGNGHKRTTSSRNKHGALLRGLLWCTHCNRRMTHTFSRKRDRVYRYYTCRRAQSEGWHSCPVKSVAAGDVEAAVVDEVRATIQGDEALLRATVAEVKRQRKARVVELRRELRIAELDQANGDDRHAEKLAAELATLQADRIHDAEVAEAVEEWEALWDALAYAEQAEVAALLIERVTYDGDAVDITFRETTDA